MKYNRLLVITLGIILIFASSFKTEIEKNGGVEISIPYLNSVRIDGQDLEWDSFDWNSLYADNLGEQPDAKDLNAFFKLAWNDSGLHFIFKVCDDKIYSDSLHPWESDHVEFFIAPFRGSEDIIQLTLLPPMNESANPFIVMTDYRKSPDNRHRPVLVKASFSNSDSCYIIEGSTNSESLGKAASSGHRLALQFKIGDTDLKREKGRNYLYWHPLGHSYQNSYAMFSIQFSEKNYHIPQGTSRLIINDNDNIDLLVFGKDKKRLMLKNEHSLILDTLITPDISNEILKIDLSHKNLNIEEDSLFVYLNNEMINLHETFISPRIYNNLEKPPFEREIRTFLFKDKICPPPVKAVLFLGSSSISRWYGLKEAFPEYEIIQRGFGGSTSEDVLLYMEKIVLPYYPSKIFYYEGDNDIRKGIPVKEIYENIKEFVEQINRNLPETQIYLISPKISLSRIRYQEKYENLHASMKKLAMENKMVHYVDVASPMINSKGEVNDSLFMKDGIHLNEKGYAIWKEVINLSIDSEGN
jgi:lysophospholipase L1-like esterase